MLSYFFLMKGTTSSSTLKKGRQGLERRRVHGRGRALKSEGTLEQVETQVRIFHIKRDPGQFLQEQTTS